MIVWDHKDDPPDGIGEVLCWQSYTHGGRISSVPRYLEDHAERLRAKYLAFVYDLGESRIDGKRIVDHLNLGDGFSFWWMTQVCEKSPFKSPRIYDCLRLMALEELILEREICYLTLDTSNRNLAQAVQSLCRNLRINFVWRPGRKSRQKWSLRSVYGALPYPMQGLISLRHLVRKWPLRKLQKPQWFFGEGAIFLCSYFFNMDRSSCANGQFYSHQWEGLPKLLRDGGKHTNWIHHFLFSPGTPDARTGLDWLRLFNRDAYTQGCHTFLETYLSLGVVLRALRIWLWLNVVSWRLRKGSHAFQPKGSAVWLWPFLRSDWRTSLSGTVAMSNCLWVELFDAALKDMPRQNTGLYLWENQGWESALLRAWRRHGHGEIIGVPHTTVAFWHLNNFDDARNQTLEQDCTKLRPNRLAVNGPMAWKAFAKTGYPVDQLIEVEALRFQYLIGLDSRKAEKPANYAGAARFSSQGLTKTVLVLGDFTVKQTLKMLRCIEVATQLVDIKISVTLKPHPVCRIEREDYPSLSFELTNKPLAEIMKDFDLAFSSNTSSAGLDALLAGLAVVIYLDEEDLNHSPLRGVGNVQFVSTPKELAAALRSGECNAAHPSVEEFFWLNSQMPKWRRVLLEAGNTR